MSKIDTDQGLGPGSERQRRELMGIKEQKRPVDKNAETEPGLGKVERQPDPVDDLLDGFGPNRPDLPRILPQADTTPPPDPVNKEHVTSTQPGKRQWFRNRVVAMVIAFVVTVAFGIAMVKLGASSATAPAPTGPTSTARPTVTALTTTPTALPSGTETAPPPPTITTMQVDSLPTSRTVPAPTGRPVHSAATTTAATGVATHPTGSAPPGMNLLPDDPHR